MTRHRQSGAPRSGASDRTGMFLLAAAFTVAPFQIWALAIVGRHGITLAHAVSLLFVGLLVVRVTRMSVTAAIVAYTMLAVLLWGLAAAYLQANSLPSAGRTVRNLLLYGIMTLSFAGATTVRLRWDRAGRPWKVAVAVYVVIAVYAVYQTYARRHMLPGAFLPVTNPTYSADASAGGVQAGATVAALQWGEYWYRASATFSEPSHFGRFLAWWLAVCLATIQLGSRFVRLAVLGVILTLAALMANYSLSGIFDCALVAGVYILGAARNLRGRHLVKIVLAAIVTLLITQTLAPSVLRSVGERVRQLVDHGESSERYTAVPRVVAMFVDKPWGVGLAGVEDANQIHNGIMLWLLQYGVVGLIPPLLWFAGIAFGTVLLIYGDRRLKPETRCNVSLSVGFLAAHLAMWMTSGEMSEPLSWVCSGFAFGFLGRRLDKIVVRKPAASPSISIPAGRAAHSGVGEPVAAPD